jgi:hypothetical protein
MDRVYKVFIGSPVYKWPPEPHMAMSVQKMMEDPRFDADFRAVVGDAHIERARASCLAEYLEYTKEWDYFLNIDWDIEFNPDDVYRMCERDLPVLGGPYTFKSDREDKNKSIVFRPLLGEDRKEDYTLQCAYIGGGFTMIRGDVIKKLMENYEELSFWENPDMHDPPRKTYALWNPIMLPREDWGEDPAGGWKKELLSEDYSLCQRILDMNIPIHMDLQVLLTHWQDGHPWRLDTNQISDMGESKDDG